MLTVDLAPHYAAFGTPATVPGKPEELVILEPNMDMLDNGVAAARVPKTTAFEENDTITIDGETYGILSMSEHGYNEYVLTLGEPQI